MLHQRSNWLAAAAVAVTAGALAFPAVGTAVDTAPAGSSVTSSVRSVAPAAAARRTDNIWNCVFLVTGAGVSLGGGATPLTALGVALSAREVGGCGAWMASAICRGTHFWGPFGTPYRRAVSYVTQGRYSVC